MGGGGSGGGGEGSLVVLVVLVVVAVVVVVCVCLCVCVGDTQCTPPPIPPQGAKPTYIMLMALARMSRYGTEDNTYT